MMPRLMLATLPLLALAACGAPAGDNNLVSSLPATNNAIANAAGSPADEAAGLSVFRSQWLEACIGGGRDAAPPGTPVDRHCACAIDRVMAGKTLAQVEEERSSGAYRERFLAEMRACIREIPS